MDSKRAKPLLNDSMKKKKVSQPLENRVIFTEHTSFPSKALDSNRKTDTKVSRNNIDYLTSKEAPKTYAKATNKKSKTIRSKRQELTNDVEEKQDFFSSVEKTEKTQQTQQTKLKTVFQRPEETEVIEEEQPQKYTEEQNYAHHQIEKILSKKPEPAHKKPSIKPHGPHESDENYVSLDKLELTNKKLGEGGFSFVYEGNWLGTNVAVKIINITNKNTQAKAIKQIKTLIKLRHPRIIQLYKYSLEQTKTGTHIYIIMQKMQGDLTTYSYLNLADRVKVIKQTAEALRMLHEQSIAHRDIKPQNILFDTKGDIRLADLGISALLDEEQTHSITVAYTLKYAPREVCIDEITNLKNDIWSFGLVIYQVLTGLPPWRNCKKGQITEGLITRKWPLDENWREKIDQVVIIPQNVKIITSLLEDCLKYDMQSRPPIAQVQDRLNRLNMKC